MRKLWNKFRRWIGFPALDLELPILAAFVVDVDFLTLNMVIRRDLQYWLDAVIGANNWSHDLGAYDANDIDYVCDKEDFVIILRFRHQRHMDLYKLNWFSGRGK